MKDLFRKVDDEITQLHFNYQQEILNNIEESKDDDPIFIKALELSPMSAWLESEAVAHVKHGTQNLACGHSRVIEIGFQSVSQDGFTQLKLCDTCLVSSVSIDARFNILDEKHFLASHFSGFEIQDDSEAHFFSAKYRLAQPMVEYFPQWLMQDDLSCDAEFDLLHQAAMANKKGSYIGGYARPDAHGWDYRTGRSLVKDEQFIAHFDLDEWLKGISVSIFLCQKMTAPHYKLMVILAEE